MILTIHQPNFIPWYPFFQKIEQADVFIILSRCQFEKNNFQNRFNMNNNWYTMSTNKGLDPIKTKTYLDYKKDWNKIKVNLSEYNLSIFDECISDSLVKTNTFIIKKICKLLGMETIILNDIPTTFTGTDRLVEICKYYNADTYLSGISGKKYLELDKFKNNKIEIKFQNEDTMIKKPIIKILKEKKYV